MKKKMLAITMAMSVTLGILTGCSGNEKAPEMDQVTVGEEITKTDEQEGLQTETQTEPQTDVQTEPQKDMHTEALSEMVTKEYVTVDAGRLLGYKEDEIYNFKGIPYAYAERFKDPVPVTAYDGGEHLALYYGPVSPQSRTFSSSGEINMGEYITPSGSDMVGNEQCQYLNVWSKDLTAKKPVVVFFHGGGLNSGSSNELNYYNGRYIVEKEDIVFVSVNHRLNVLGYLDLSAYGEEYADSGIAGMKDCVESLKWVQKNIALFGGDPDNVTIVGQSGGGTKVITLACMSDTEDLFDKVVVMSGMGQILPQSDGLENTQKLVTYLDLAEDEVISTLSNMPYEELLGAFEAAGCSASAHYGGTSFESPLFDENGSMNPYAAERTWIVGTAYSEFSGNNSPAIMMINFDTGATFDFDGGDKEGDLAKIDDETAMARLKETYGEKTDAIVEAYKKSYPAHKLSELLFINHGTTRYDLVAGNDPMMKLFNDNGVKVYNYIVSYTLPYFGGMTMGHTNDVPFWFNSLDEIRYQVKGDEMNAYGLASAMSGALASFAADGDPSIDGMEWKPYTNDEHNTMVFDIDPQNKVDFDTELLELMFSE